MSKHKHHHPHHVTVAPGRTSAGHVIPAPEVHVVTEDEAKMWPAAEYLRWRLNEQLAGRAVVAPAEAWGHRTELERTIKGALVDARRAGALA